LLLFPTCESNTIKIGRTRPISFGRCSQYEPFAIFCEFFNGTKRSWDFDQKAHLILCDYLNILLVSRKTYSDKRWDGSYPRKYVNTPSSGVVCTSFFNHIFFGITKINDDYQDLLPPSRHQVTISRRFRVLNVAFRPVSSERRQHTSGHTDSHETIKPFSWKEAGLKTDILR